MTHGQLVRSSFAGLVLGFSLTGCDAWTESDNARSTTGPSIVVHCDAAEPIGDTTAKIACPTAVPNTVGTGTRTGRAH